MMWRDLRCQLTMIDEQEGKKIEEAHLSQIYKYKDLRGQYYFYLTIILMDKGLKIVFNYNYNG